MKIQRMINWTAGLSHQFSLMRVFHGHRTCAIIVLQNVGGMACWRMKIEWNFNETNPSHLKKETWKFEFFFRSFASRRSRQGQIRYWISKEMKSDKLVNTPELNSNFITVLGLRQRQNSTIMMGIFVLYSDIAENMIKSLKTHILSRGCNSQ